MRIKSVNSTILQQCREQWASPSPEVSDISKGCGVNDMALIAYALEIDATVVTGESYQVNRPGDKRNYKIPLFCKEKGAEYIQFVPMLERLGFGR